MLFQSVIVVLLAIARCDILVNSNSGSIFSPKRLPTQTKPIYYDLHITTNIHLEHFRYKGYVIINIKVLNDTDEIVLHADSSLRDIKVNLADKKTAGEFHNLTYNRNECNDFLVIHSEPNPMQLKANKEYILTISFNGTIGNKEGFYKSEYYCDTNAGRRLWTAATIFEPFYARLAFPCYDEPQFKARFKISLTHARNYTALSNMPQDGIPIKLDDDMVTTKFQESPPMSTYTVAFLVGIIDKNSTNIENITTNVYYSTLGSKGEYALDVAAKSLNAFEKYFEVYYPFPKLDHISSIGLRVKAMENWDLIIYKYRCVLKNLDDKVEHLYGAFVVAHVVAHQWFGNSVTPKWWNHVWLNEGIATFYAYKILDMAYPDLRAYEFYLLSIERQAWTTFELWPMTSNVYDKDLIWKRFSAIYHWKGSQIMRMFEHAIGEVTFKKGVTKYLRKYQYSSVEENDLFECLQEAASEDRVPKFEKKGAVAKMMSSWTNQMHYPLLIVKVDRQQNTITVTQRPIVNYFLYGYRPPKYFRKADDKRLWWIPITMATASNPDFNATKPNFIFPNETTVSFSPADIPIKYDAANDWLILNNQNIGLYMVLYDEENYCKIIEALQKNTTAIHSYNKVQLVRDASYLAKEGQLSHLIVFKLYDSLKDDPDILVLNEILSNLEGASYWYGGLFNYIVDHIRENLLEKVGKEKQPDDTPLKQAVRNRFIYKHSWSWPTFVTTCC